VNFVILGCDETVEVFNDSRKKKLEFINVFVRILQCNLLTSKNKSKEEGSNPSELKNISSFM
jgi:hypothetical protein